MISLQPPSTMLERDLPIRNPALAIQYARAREKWWGACRSAYVYHLAEARYGPSNVGLNLVNAALFIATLEAELDAIRNCDIALRQEAD